MSRWSYFHQYAKDQPIYDFHNHLPPEEIAKDKNFDNISELWLGGDHYKWRAQRAVGIPEEQITGNVDPFLKFQGWAQNCSFDYEKSLISLDSPGVKEVF